VALAERDAREEEARAVAEMQRKYEEERRAIERGQFLGGARFQRHGPMGPTVADYEEEDRLRGVLDTRDTYHEEESHTPPYGRYEGFEEGGDENGGDEEDEEEIRDRW
jgi:very-short-patch-repair endonuclease